MKLNEEQKLGIREMLTFALKYQETFDELYDHVLQSLECLPGNYTDEFGQVMETEFGGYENLKNIEEKSMMQTYTAMRKRHRQNIARFFNWPTIAFTALLVIAGGFIDKNPATHGSLMEFTYISALSPLLVILYKRGLAKYRAWQTGVYKKPSIKDRYILLAAGTSCNLVCGFSFCTRNYDFYGVTTLVVFVAFSIFTMSLFKLYNQEHKSTVAA